MKRFIGLYKYKKLVVLSLTMSLRVSIFHARVHLTDGLRLLNSRIMHPAFAPCYLHLIKGKSFPRCGARNICGPTNSPARDISSVSGAAIADGDKPRV